MDVDANLIMPNAFARIKRKKPLSRAAKNIETYIVHNIDTFNSSDFPRLRVTKNLFQKLGISKSNVSKIFESTLKELQDYEIEFINAQGQRVNTRLCAGFTVIEEGEVYELGFHPALAPIFLEIQKHYTKMSFELILGVGEGSEYTYNLYNLLRTEYDRLIYLSKSKSKNLASLPFSLKILRDSLGACNVYPRPSEFDRNVLKRAVAEINKKTDLLVVSYKPYKSGRPIIGYKFRVRAQEYQQEFNFNFEEMPKMAELEDLKISKRISDILKKFTYQLHGQAKIFIESAICDFGENVVYMSLNKLYQVAKNYPDKVKGGLVKNRLQEQIDIYQKERKSEEDLKKLKLSSKKKKAAKEAYQKLLDSNIESFMVFEEDKVNKIKEKIISENASNLIDFEEPSGRALLDRLVKADLQVLVQEQIGSEALFVEKNLMKK